MPRKIFTPPEGLGEFDYDDVDAEALLRMGDDGFAAVYPPPGGDEVFDDQFLRRARETTRMPNNLLPVHIIQQRIGNWTGNNQLGNEQAFQANSNNEQTILKMDEWGFPQVWSVMLGMTFTPSSTASGFPPNFNVIAKVIAGVGGTTQEFEVDWNNGSTFSCVFNAINIIAAYSTDVDIPRDLRLKATIGHRSLSENKPTRTFAKLAVAAGTDQLFAIPNFAKSVHILPSGGTPFTSDVLISIRNSIITSGSLSMRGDDLLTTIGSLIPIPGGAQLIDFNNLGATNIGFSLVFNLAF